MVQAFPEHEDHRVSQCVAISCDLSSPTDGQLPKDEAVLSVVGLPRAWLFKGSASDSCRQDGKVHLTRVVSSLASPACPFPPDPLSLPATKGTFPNYSSEYFLVGLKIPCHPTVGLTSCPNTVGLRVYGASEPSKEIDRSRVLGPPPRGSGPLVCYSTQKLALPHKSERFG